MSKEFLDAKRTGLEKDLRILTLQYEEVSQTLRLTLDPAMHVTLKLKLEQIEAQVNEADSKLRDVLRKLEVSNLSKPEGAKNVAVGVVPAAPPQVFGVGKKWAVLVGINHFEDNDHYGTLSVCVNDAEAMGQKLAATGYQSRVLNDKTDPLPTRNQVINALKVVADATNPDDLLLFYFSGHGDVADEQGYLVPRDGFRPSLSDTAIPIVRVEQIMRGAPARAKVLILDACHSGAQIPGKAAYVMSEQFIRQVYEQAEGLAILGSCKQGQLSYERDEKDLSVFTHFLLKALAPESVPDGKNFVSVTDASRYVVNEVKAWAAANDRVQTPTLKYEVAGDIILVDFRE